jgi:cytochrome c553
MSPWPNPAQTVSLNYLPMRIFAVVPAAFVAFATLSVALTAAELPTWAFPVAPPNPPRAPAAPGTPPPARSPAAPVDETPKHVPNASVSLTNQQLKAHGPAVPDWHPEEHPAMPAIVNQGREPAVWACAFCHLPTGAGRPENASIAGLPVAYIKQQVLAFKNGDRPGAEPKRGPQNNMILIGKAATEDEAEAAAEYFAALKPQTFMKVVEAEMVPKTFVAGSILAKAPGGGMEPIGNRIIEVPVELDRFELRDSRTPYEVYVPVGSLKRGSELVATGGGKTQQCTICHGPALKGLGDVPRLAGRSPSYLMRQLYDVQNGTRTGASTALMKIVVANLTNDDMLALSAYISSLEP